MAPIYFFWKKWSFRTVFMKLIFRSTRLFPSFSILLNYFGFLFSVYSWKFDFFFSWLRHHPPLGLLASKIPNGETAALKFIILECVQKVTAKLLKKLLMNCPPGKFFSIWLFCFGTCLIQNVFGCALDM